MRGARARPSGMSDPIVLPSTHPVIAHAPAVVGLIDEFLRDGRLR
jgi:hypothetical protein